MTISFIDDVLGDDLRWITPEAKCTRVENPDMFYPPKGAPNVAAKRICRRCPLIDECLRYALRHEVWGVWGGTSGQERDQMRGWRTGRRQAS